jgi:hypothetical protein
VAASPIFINVSPTVKVVPNSNKVPTYSAGIAIKPNPDPGTVTNEYGKVQPLNSRPCLLCDCALCCQKVLHRCLSSVCI